MCLRITAGSFKARKIPLADEAIRPTEEKVRAALFNTLFALRDLEGTLFYDLFAGSGAVGIEAVSRGAAQVIFTERDRKRARFLEGQLSALGIADRARVFCADAFSARVKEFLPRPADIIFIDPPYAERERLMPLAAQCIREHLVAPDGILIVESDGALPDEVEGWQKKEKRYGGTYLSFFIRRDPC